jgi:YihY family inner membrane protein
LAAGKKSGGIIAGPLPSRLLIIGILDMPGDIDAARHSRRRVTSGWRRMPPPDPARRSRQSRPLLVARHPLAFALRVIRGLRRNRALLLSGALAYNGLLTLVPLLALLLLALSHVMDEARLLHGIQISLELVIPGQAQAMTEEIAALLMHRELIGGLGILMLLFFSGLAFGVLQDAFSLIFEHRFSRLSRHRLVSLFLPWLFALALGAGLLILVVALTALETLGQSGRTIPGLELPLEALSGPLIGFVGFAAQAVLLAALYIVMPVGMVRVREALVGGLVAAAVWDPLRRMLGWYFSSVSFVSVAFGSIGTAVVVLLFMEAGALVVLLGAQVIAEYEQFVYREGAARSPGSGRAAGRRRPH